MSLHEQQAAKILVVDDEPRMCESLRFLLEKQDFSVSTALTGTNALQWIAKEHFDVAVLDVGLPDINGIQVMEYIKSSGHDTSFVVITGNATLDSAVSALRNGAFDYLKKPFEYDQLLNTIQNILDQKKLRHENHEITGRLAESEER
jgi:DNA-binding NtrC family response regulator